MGMMLYSKHMQWIQQTIASMLIGLLAIIQPAAPIAPAMPSETAPLVSTTTMSATATATATMTQPVVSQLQQTSLPAAPSQTKAFQATPRKEPMEPKATTPPVPSQMASTKKTCVSGAVVSITDNCTKTCPDGEVVLEALTCRSVPASTAESDVRPDQKQSKIAEIERRYGILIDDLQLKQIEIRTMYDTGSKREKISDYYGALSAPYPPAYPTFIDTEYKRSILKEITGEYDKSNFPPTQTRTSGLAQMLTEREQQLSNRIAELTIKRDAEIRAVQ